MDIFPKDELGREIVDVAALNPVMHYTPDDLYAAEAYSELDSLAADSQSYSEDMRFYLDEPSHLAAELIGSEGMGLTAIYTREAPYLGHFQNGLTWYMPETKQETGEFHRIRTNVITSIMPILYSAEDDDTGTMLSGWYLITTASRHSYLVYFSLQNPEYIPLRPNPPVLQ